MRGRLVRAENARGARRGGGFLGGEGEEEDVTLGEGGALVAGAEGEGFGDALADVDAPVEFAADEFDLCLFVCA